MCLTGEGTPSITFGSTNSGYSKPNMTSGDHEAIQVSSQKSLWATKMSDLSFNRTSILSTDYKAFLSSSTYDIALPTSVYNKYVEHVQLLNITNMNCSSERCVFSGKCSKVTDQLPTLVI